MTINHKITMEQKLSTSNWQKVWNKLGWLIKMLEMFSFKITEQYYIYFHFLPWMCPRFSSVTQSWLILCDLMDFSTPGFPVLHQLRSLLKPCPSSQLGCTTILSPSSPYPPAFNLFQHQGLFQLVSSAQQGAWILELQLQHQSLQWIFRADFL